MNLNKIPMREVVYIAVGEAIVSLLICLGFLAFKKFDYTVLTGAILGGAVTVFNFLFLCVSVNRATDKFLSEYESYVPRKEEDENEDDPYDDKAAKFARENQAKLTAAIKLSYFVRTLTVICSLVIAFLTGVFNIIATVIPLLCLKPILTASELIRRKEDAK